MSYRDNAISRLRRLPIEKGLREGIAIAKARQWRPTIKSKAQVKRRARGLKYAVKSDDTFLDRDGNKTAARVAKSPIRRYESWQFPDMSLKKALAHLAEIGYISAKSQAMYYAAGPEDNNKITDSQANEIFTDLLHKQLRIEKNNNKAKKSRSLRDKLL